MKQLIKAFRFLHYMLHWFGYTIFEWSYVLIAHPSLLPSMWRIFEWSAFRSPYRAAHRNKLLRQPSDTHTHTDHLSLRELTYGEIALTTIDRILDHIDTTPGDHIFDLGSGRGRVVMVAADRGIRSTGVEILPELIQLSRYAVSSLNPKADFVTADFLHTDLTQATIIWMAGTCWSQQTLHDLANKIESLPQRPLIISVSAPLPHTPIIEQIQGWTSWGRERFYLQRHPA
jgi:SAM-dependent methyltransferase